MTQESNPTTRNESEKHNQNEIIMEWEKEREDFKLSRRASLL
jgi:hypothetical protein